jgi:hypothetical protein
VRGCELAQPEAHQLDSVNVKGDVENLSAYLSSYCGEYEKDPLKQNANWQMFYALMWATQTRSWRPSDGAQKYMKHDPPEEPTDFEAVAILDSHGDRHLLSDRGGGVSTLSAYSSYYGYDPPQRA